MNSQTISSETCINRCHYYKNLLNRIQFAQESVNELPDAVSKTSAGSLLPRSKFNVEFFLNCFVVSSGRLSLIVDSDLNLDFCLLFYFHYFMPGSITLKLSTSATGRRGFVCGGLCKRLVLMRGDELSTLGPITSAPVRCMESLRFQHWRSG